MILFLLLNQYQIIKNVMITKWVFSIKKDSDNSIQDLSLIYRIYF